MKNKNLTLSKVAFEKLEELIVTLELEPGQIVTESELSELLKIGRMPVREALKTLEYMHLVKTIPYRGIMITEVKIDEMFLQMQVRKVLEKLVSVRAAKLATNKEREKLSEIKKEYSTIMTENDSRKLLCIDQKFHSFLSKISRNPYASSSLYQLLSLDRRLYFISHNASQTLIQKINVAHLDLMSSIIEGDLMQTGINSGKLLDAVTELYYSNIDNFTLS